MPKITNASNTTKHRIDEMLRFGGPRTPGKRKGDNRSLDRQAHEAFTKLGLGNEVVSTKVSAPTAEVGTGTVITAKVNGRVRRSGQKNETNEYKAAIEAILAEDDTKAVAPVLPDDVVLRGPSKNYYMS